MSNKLHSGIIAGSTALSLTVKLRDLGGNPKTGVTANQVTASYWRQGGNPVQITVSALGSLVASHAPGGWYEASQSLKPGSYRFDVPNEAIAVGADWSELEISVSGCDPFTEFWELVGWVVPGQVPASITPDTAANVITLVQTLMQDSAGDEYTTALLLPVLNSAYRTLQRDLSIQGVGSSRQTVILTIPIGTAYLDYTTTPALPADLLIPHRLWEKGSGSSEKYQEMAGPVSDLPDWDSTEFIKQWSWKGSKLQFLAATREVSLKLSYEKGFPILDDAGSYLQVVGAVDCLAFKTVELMARANGSGMAEEMAQLYTTEMSRLGVFNNRPKQHQVFRRRRFSSRWI